MVTLEALKYEVYQVAVDRQLLCSFEAGSLRYIDAAELVRRVLGDQETSIRTMVRRVKAIVQGAQLSVKGGWRVRLKRGSTHLGPWVCYKLKPFC